MMPTAAPAAVVTAAAVLVMAMAAAQAPPTIPPPIPLPPSNQTATSTNRTNATVPAITNQTNVTAPIAPPPPPRPANATVPPPTAVLNQTNASGSLPPPPPPPQNQTAPPPSLNRTNASAPTNVMTPLNRTNVTTTPTAFNQSGAANQTVPISPPTMTTTSAVPVMVQGASVGVITPGVAQSQTSPPGQPAPPGLNANDVVAIVGWNGTIIDGGETLLLKLPRSQQLDFRVKDIFVPGVSSAASFRPLSDGTVNVMVELVLLDDEVGPALRSGLGHGLHVMALHTHFLFDAPRAYFLHLHGAGLAAPTAAAAVRNLSDTVAAVRAAPPSAAGAAPLPTRASTLALDPIQTALAPSGLQAAKNADDGSVSMSAPPLTCSVMGYNASHTLGCESAATFAGSDSDAIVYGQFCSPENLLQRVLVGVLNRDLTVTSIVNHFIGDRPETKFVHFWGRGPAQALASAVAQAFAESYRQS